MENHLLQELKQGYEGIFAILSQVTGGKYFRKEQVILLIKHEKIAIQKMLKPTFLLRLSSCVHIEFFVVCDS